MGRCGRCGNSIVDGSFACPRCGGTALPEPPGAGRDGAFPPGTVLSGRYRIERILGTGSAGLVYGAADLLAGQPVALKLLWSAGGTDGPEFQRLRREVLSAQKARHPNVVAVHDILLLEGRPALVMEWVEGGTLKARVQEGGSIPSNQALALAEQLFSGLAHLHGLGILHRDVKSGNILLAGDGSLKLGDFGLAKGEDLGATLTATGATLGTPAYMAPEVIRGRKASERSDLYSAGVVLFEMLSGRLPFEGSTSAEALSRQLADPPPVHLLREAKVPRWLHRFVARLLEKDPRDRFASAGTVLEALTVHASPWHLPRRWRARLAACAAFTILLAATLWAVSKYGRGPELPSSVIVQDRTARAVDAKGRILWSRTFPGKIRAVHDWDNRPGARVRYLALYGGAWDNWANFCGPPRAEALTASGETTTRVNLAEDFNPYRDGFPPEQFGVSLQERKDVDFDGFEDAVILLTHTMYPTLVYTLSGKDGRVVGAAANSGHIESMKLFRTSQNNSIGWSALCLGINNRMGHQVVLFSADLIGYGVSPDLDVRGSHYFDFGSSRFSVSPGFPRSP